MMAEDAELRQLRAASHFLLGEARRCGLVVRGTMRVDGAEWRVALYDPLRFREIGTAVGTVQEVIRLMDYYAAHRDRVRGLPDWGA